MPLRSPRRPIRRGLPHLVDFGWRERLTRTHVAMCVALGKGKLRHQRFLPEELSWRNFPVFDAWTLKIQRAQHEQRRRLCYQTFLKRPQNRKVGSIDGSMGKRLWGYCGAEGRGNPLC